MTLILFCLALSIWTGPLVRANPAYSGGGGKVDDEVIQDIFGGSLGARYGEEEEDDGDWIEVPVQLLPDDDCGPIQSPQKEPEMAQMHEEFIPIEVIKATNNMKCDFYTEKEGYECVPYYQCDAGTIITDGAGLLDIRWGKDVCEDTQPEVAVLDSTDLMCPGSLDVCCKDPDFEKPTCDVPEPLVDYGQQEYEPEPEVCAQVLCCGSDGITYSTPCDLPKGVDCVDNNACPEKIVKQEQESEESSESESDEDGQVQEVQEVEDQTSCTVAEDCYSDDKMCHGIQDVYCICKQGQCKISAGCGEMGAFCFKECSTCSEDDCEDTGKCIWDNNQCSPKEACAPEKFGGYEPVCGEDEAEYNNAAYAACMGVKVQCEGSCPCDAVIIEPYSYTFQPKCGRRNEYGIGVKIENYKDDESQFGEWPHMCAILRKEVLEDTAGQQSAPSEQQQQQQQEYQQPEPQTIFVFQGGASLIEPNVVLTGAHKVAEFVDSPETLVIRCGEWDTQTEGEPLPHQQIQVKQIILHPEFNAKNMANSIALVILETSFSLAEHLDTICLPHNGEIFHSDECFVKGWGKDHFGADGIYQVVMKRPFWGR